MEPAPRRRQMNRPRVAEMIAGEIRQRILDGQLVDGDMLPKVDDLADDYRVSKPSVREAMRILETEGLISARRGGAGGAEVHMPTASTAAHTLGMILQSTHATVADLAAALLVLEPTCAAMTAGRDDRADEVIPRLRAIHHQLEEKRGDPAGFSLVARQFHQAIVNGCGNAALALVAGAWSRCGPSTRRPGWSSATPNSTTTRGRSRCWRPTSACCRRSSAATSWKPGAW